MINFKKLKLEIFYLQAAFRQYRQGPDYLRHRYFFARKILNLRKIFQNPINYNNLSIHFLLCHRDLIPFIWSLASFYLASDFFGHLIIHNDGSLTKKDKNLIKKFFLQTQIIEEMGKLDNLPSNYRLLIDQIRNFYQKIPLLKKLLEPYLFNQTPIHLIIDSDLLWFKNPTELEKEIKDGSQKSLMMCGEGGGCPVIFKDGTKLEKPLSFFNSGIVLYHRNNFNLEKLAEYCQKVDWQNSANIHFLEQAAFAFSLNNLTPLPSDQYLIKGGVDSQTIVRHYTSPRRPLFYSEGLKILKDKIFE